MTVNAVHPGLVQQPDARARRAALGGVAGLAAPLLAPRSRSHRSLSRRCADTTAASSSPSKRSRAPPFTRGPGRRTAPVEGQRLADHLHEPTEAIPHMILRIISARPGASASDKFAPFADSSARARAVPTRRAGPVVAWPGSGQRSHGTSAFRLSLARLDWELPVMSRGKAPNRSRAWRRRRTLPRARGSAGTGPSRRRWRIPSRWCGDHGGGTARTARHLRARCSIMPFAVLHLLHHAPRSQSPQGLQPNRRGSADRRARVAARRRSATR